VNNVVFSFNRLTHMDLVHEIFIVTFTCRLS